MRSLLEWHVGTFVVLARPHISMLTAGATGSATLSKERLADARAAANASWCAGRRAPPTKYSPSWREQLRYIYPELRRRGLALPSESSDVYQFVRHVVSIPRPLGRLLRPCCAIRSTRGRWIETRCRRV
jgi:hypothetical protein